MARLVFGMMQSLDGYVAGADGGPGLPMPDDALHRHFSDHMRGLSGGLYGRRMYELMRYWDGDQPEGDDVGRAFAAAWQALPKWVVSKTLRSVGPNATLLSGSLAEAVRVLKADHEGEIEVAGPELAGGLAALGLIDEYRLYVCPVVLGAGKPFFAGPCPPLRLVDSERIGEATLKLTYVPA